MRHPYDLHPERPELDRAAVGVDLAQLRRVQEPVLVELRLDQPEREPRGQHRAHPDLAQEVRQRADVVLVRVGEDHGEHVPVAQVAEVGKDQVDAQMLVAREREPGVDHERLSGELEDGHVLAHLAEPAERDHP